MQIEIGKNLKSVLKQMIKDCPEEIRYISPIGLFEDFLKNEDIKEITVEKTESEGGTCFDIRIRKVK